MIQFENYYAFTNDYGKWRIKAETQEHPNAYGNGMVLRMTRVEFPSKEFASMPQTFDIRYESLADEDDVDMLVRELIDQEYGVRL